MKIFAVKDEEDFSRKALAYLLYYERPKQFYIELPDSFLLRYQKKVEDVIPLNHANLLVFFRDGSVKKYNATVFLSGKIQFRQLLKNENLFRKVNVQPGGYGICWGENLTITDSELYEHGKPIPLSMEDFRDFVSYRIVGTREATEILDCSRQNIDNLVRRDKLHPVKTDSKNKLFLKSEILQRNWK